MIWTYMGPPELQPERPPEMPFTLVPEAERRGLKFLVEANFLQCLEGELDTAHVSFLHQTFGEDGTGIQTLVRNDGYANDRHPRLFALDTDYGFVYGGGRSQRAGKYYLRGFPIFMAVPGFFPRAAGGTRGGASLGGVERNNTPRDLACAR